MVYVIAIFKFLGVAFKFGFGLIKSGAFWITVAFSSGVTAIGVLGYKLWSSIPFFTDLLWNANTRIQSFISWLNTFDTFALVYNTLALDVLFQSLFTFFSFAFVLIAFIVVDMMIAGLVTFSTFLAWRVQAKLLTAFTGGMVKT